MNNQQSAQDSVPDDEYDGDSDDVIVSRHDLVAGRSYWFVMVVLVAVILTTGIAIVRQTQLRHDTYRQLSQARQAYQLMKTEESRLIIEQQTFSATPIVAQRSVVELGMFYPIEKNRIIVHLPNP